MLEDLDAAAAKAAEPDALQSLLRDIQGLQDPTLVAMWDSDGNAVDPAEDDIRAFLARDKAAIFQAPAQSTEVSPVTS